MSTGGGGTPGDAPAGMVWGGNGWVPASVDPMSSVVENQTTGSGSSVVVSDGNDGWDVVAGKDPGTNLHWIRYKNGAGGWTYATEPDVPPSSDVDWGKREAVYHDLDDVQEDPGWFGRQFQNAGYKYLGPGTDLGYNERNNVEPINELDAIAKIHDYDYKRVRDDFEHGVITYDEAVNLVDKADRDFVERARLSGSVRGYLAARGMTSKIFLDSVVGPTFAGVKRGNYGSRRSEIEGTRDGDYVWVWNGYGAGTGMRKVYHPKAWDERNYPPYVPPSSKGNGNSSFTYGMSVFDEDRDRNYFPDRRQAVYRHRKRRRPY